MFYKQTGKDDLDDWKRLLSAEDIIKLESDLMDYVWYSVVNGTDVIAVFQIINVIDVYSKNIDIKFAPTVRDEHESIVDVMMFIFQSMLNISSNKNIKKIKMHTHDPLMEVIFRELSQVYHTENIVKSVRKYGKWVEIEL